MTEPEKQCSKCLAFKPLGEFHNDKNKKDGKRAECRCCTREAARKRRAANPEKQREYDRKRYAANPEKYNEYRRKRRAANPEKCKESQRQYRAANHEKVKSAERQYRAAARHARNQCAVINALDPKKWEILQSKLKAMDSTKTKEKE
jgi:alpha-galactosidase/6-phospho-beta-glucosidase family protein